MSTHKRYNAFNPLATPAQALSWLAFPFVALARLSDSLLATEEALRAMRREAEFLNRVGRTQLGR
ncbi:hypothetical protein GH975_10770 [Litorivicinus lipolyticus]|uniref:Uncharacterized protein n=1 Tax=Litorivicinus lipolyticus TaxID=418701 RepID=A0A5Q2QFB4_9GAMM|nr:hypothetical protein [Litorivicinus lipolyticus]QGG81022.1 hypothetical protein GH975_10770 [Litorivicinus lipolyticus]